MKTIIAGASGFIGQHLCSMLKSIGDEIITLSREDFITGKFDLLVHKLNGADRIFNLAGAPLNRRWTREYKKEIFNSRIRTTAKLVAAINEQPTPPSLFVSTSAIGYYPSDGAYIENAEVYTPTFLAYICRKWEKEAEQVTPQTRLVITRLAPLWVRRENRSRETSFSLDNVNRPVTHLQVHHRTYRSERCFKLLGTRHYRQCTMDKITRARASSSGIVDNSAISAQSDLRRKICTTH